MNSSRFSALAFGLLVAATPGLAAAVHHHNPSQHKAKASDLAAAINGILKEPAVARAHWGISIVAEDGVPLYAYNDAQLFEPGLECEADYDGRGAGAAASRDYLDDYRSDSGGP